VHASSRDELFGREGDTSRGDTEAQRARMENRLRTSISRFRQELDLLQSVLGGSRKNGPALGAESQKVGIPKAEAGIRGLSLPFPGSRHSSPV